MFKLILLGVPAALGAIAPIPALLCPSVCRCEASATIDSTPIPADLSTPVSHSLDAVSGLGYSGHTATATLTGQGSGWGPMNGQCKKPFTVCTECTSKKCEFKFNLKVDINTWGNLPHTSGETYSWSLDIPNNPYTGTINTSTGSGQEKLVAEDLPCDTDPAEEFELAIYRSDADPPLKVFEIAISARCTDCDPTGGT